VPTVTDHRAPTVSRTFLSAAWMFQRIKWIEHAVGCKRDCCDACADVDGVSKRGVTIPIHWRVDELPCIVREPWELHSTQLSQYAALQEYPGVAVLCCGLRVPSL
jgi:hypothetical protein